MNNLDDIDLKLLNILQENSRLSTKELAAKVNLSSTPVYERVKRLENEGYIKRYVAVLDAEKLNLGFTVYCNIKLDKHNQESILEFQQMVVDIPEVTECYNLAGSNDFLLRIHAPSMDYYRRFVLETLGGIPSIGSVVSTFVMNEVKRTSTLPLNL